MAAPPRDPNPPTSNTAAELSRRRFAGLLGAAGVTAAAAGAPSFAPANAADERPFTALDRGRPLPRPNFLVILGDDLGWADLSTYGAPTIRTPNLDRLAASGVRFTQAYSASSVCSPTRFGLYTGRYPGRLVGGLQEPIGEPTEIDGIPTDHPTLASLLKGVGYDTALIGKWHCGYLPWFSPTRVGWDEFFGNFSGGLDYFSKINHNGDYDLFENEVEYDDLRGAGAVPPGRRLARQVPRDGRGPRSLHRCQPASPASQRAARGHRRVLRQ